MHFTRTHKDNMVIQGTQIPEKDSKEKKRQMILAY